MLRMTTLSWTRPRHVLALALGLAACGGGDDTGDDANDSAPTATDPTQGTSSATADDATVDASADDDDATVDASADDDGSSGITSMDSSDDAGTQTMTTMTTTLDDTGESSTGGGGLEECTESDPLCADGEMCRASMCCKDAGFCVFAAAPVCGGFVGTPCPEGLVCVLDQCVADGDGRCVESDLATAIQEAQPGCWTAG